MRDEEAARIARDLHDELGQLLTGLKIDLRSMERRVTELELGAPGNAILERAVRASATADEAIATVRRIAADLRPGTLDRLGLDAAIAQGCRDFQARTGIVCEVEVAEVPALDPDVATALYRIFQEALTNVARHANASRVAVRLSADADGVALELADDGRGLPPEPERSRHLGLFGMAERARALGGRVRVDPGAGGGTVVRATLPWPRGAGNDPG